MLVDESANRRDGFVSGATFTSDGRFASALHFESGDSVTVENSPYARSSWTFSAWVRIGADDDATDDFSTVVSTEVLTTVAGGSFRRGAPPNTSTGPSPILQGPSSE